MFQKGKNILIQVVMCKKVVINLSVYVTVKEKT